MGRALSHPLFPFFAVAAAIGAAAMTWWRDPALHPAAAVALAMGTAALALALRHGRMMAQERPMLADEIGGLHDTIDDLLDVHDDLRADVDDFLDRSDAARPGFHDFDAGSPEDDLDDEFRSTAAQSANAAQTEPAAPLARGERALAVAAAPQSRGALTNPLDALPPAAPADQPTIGAKADDAAGPAPEPSGPPLIQALRQAAPRPAPQSAPTAAAAKGSRPARKNAVEAARAVAQSRLKRDLERQRTELDALRGAAKEIDRRRNEPPQWLDPADRPDWKVPRFVRRGAEQAAPPSQSSEPNAETSTRRRARRRAAEPKVVEIAARRDSAPAARPFDPEIADVKALMTLQPMAVLADGKALFYEAALRGVRSKTQAAAQDAHGAEPSRGEADNLALIKTMTALERIGAVAPEVGVFCNLSLHSLREEPFLSAMLGYLERRRALMSRLVIEISQIELGPDPDGDAVIFERLRDQGVTLSLDHVLDLSIEPRRMQRLGFRYVKLDCEAMLARDKASPGALAHLAASFRKAGLDVVVDRIDASAQRSALAAAGVRFGQGRAIGAPVALSAVVADIQLARASRRALGDAAARATASRSAAADPTGTA